MSETIYVPNEVMEFVDRVNLTEVTVCKLTGCYDWNPGTGFGNNAYSLHEATCTISPTIPGRLTNAHV